MLLRSPAAAALTCCCWPAPWPPGRPLQHIFALTVDVDGLPGGPLWVSSNRGDSFADASPAIQQAMPQGAPSLTGIMDLHWHEKQPARILFQGKVRRRAECKLAGLGRA